ncbi:unnamed protein product [Trichogramma brassicae]|uniref:Uncharacterized protein n=1 Tax=Trichogramma brassicae TaxID=86971 RepID=A0A6H5I599_9HYME|nr:unnamed protein product [Trichogramma brassicae]
MIGVIINRKTVMIRGARPQFKCIIIRAKFSIDQALRSNQLLGQGRHAGARSCDGRKPSATRMRKRIRAPLAAALGAMTDELAEYGKDRTVERWCVRGQKFMHTSLTLPVQMEINYCL